MSGPDRWGFADNLRILVGFLVVAGVLEAVGVLGLLAAGAEAVLFAVLLLALAMFLFVFALILLLPRLLQRRTRSYRLLATQPLEIVEGALRGVLEESGHEVQVAVARSRRREPTRIVTVGGVDWWIRLEPVSARATTGGPAFRTEIVQVGPRLDRDRGAAALRERIAARLPSDEG